MVYVANEQNLKPVKTKEEARERGRNGGIASGIARREKATMRQQLEMCLEMKNKSDNTTFKELVTLGLIKGAVDGNATNYRTIVEMLGELSGETNTSTPNLKIEIIDNSSLEKTLYETNRPNKDDE